MLKRRSVTAAFVAWLGSAPATFAAEAAVRETRSVGPFDRVDWQAVGELHIAQGEREALVVEAEPRVLPALRAEVKSGVLVLSLRESVQTQAPIRVHLTVRTLSSIQASGSGDLFLAALRTPSLALKLSGSGDVTVARLQADELRLSLDGAHQVKVDGGSVQVQRIEIDGAGGYDAAALQCADATVVVRGSADVLVRVSQSLRADVSGSGQVEYFGNPPSVSRHVTGAGEVRRRGP